MALAELHLATIIMSINNFREISFQPWVNHGVVIILVAVVVTNLLDQNRSSLRWTSNQSARNVMKSFPDNLGFS